MRALLLMVLLGFGGLHGAKAKPPKDQDQGEDPRVKKALAAKWMVRVEVLMV